MDNNKYLNVNEMSIKYNCSPQNVRNFAKTHGVPQGEDRSRHKIFKFYPKWENLFANRDKKVGKRTYSKICFIQHPHQGKPILHSFRSATQAFNFANRNGAFGIKFNVTTKRFKGFFNKNPSEQNVILNFINKPNFIGPLYVWKETRNASPLYFDFDKPIDKIKLLQKYFSHGQKRLTFIQQKLKEQSYDFCERLYHADAGDGQISFNEIKKHIITEN